MHAAAAAEATPALALGWDNHRAMTFAKQKDALWKPGCKSVHWNLLVRLLTRWSLSWPLFVIVVRRALGADLSIVNCGIVTLTACAVKLGKPRYNSIIVIVTLPLPGGAGGRDAGISRQAQEQTSTARQET